MTVTRTVRAPEAADWALAHGRSALTTGELAGLLAVDADQVRRRLMMPARRGEWVNPAHGLWIPVPPEFRTWGGPPGIGIIDRLARHLGVDYYVGWLSAAEIHGAAHQAPQVVQVGVSRQVRARQVGRTRFEFLLRGNTPSVPVMDHPTRSGSARVSTPEATALDVVSDVSVVGGIDNAATVAVELAETDEFSLGAVQAAAGLFPVSSLRRLGWLLEEFSERDDLDTLRGVALDGARTAARLDPGRPLVGPLDERWNVRVNRDVEPDL